jgi:hypothetical protein
MSIPAEKIVPRTANILRRSFWTSPPIPRTIAKRVVNKKMIANALLFIIPGLSLSINCLINRLICQIVNIHIAKLVINDAIPSSECFCFMFYSLLVPNGWRFMRLAGSAFQETFYTKSHKPEIYQFSPRLGQVACKRVMVIFEQYKSTPTSIPLAKN